MSPVCGYLFFNRDRRVCGTLMGTNIRNPDLFTIWCVLLDPSTNAERPRNKCPGEPPPPTHPRPPRAVFTFPVFPGSLYLWNPISVTSLIVRAGRAQHQEPGWFLSERPHKCRETQKLRLHFQRWKLLCSALIFRCDRWLTQVLKQLLTTPGHFCWESSSSSEPPNTGDTEEMKGRALGWWKTAPAEGTSGISQHWCSQSDPSQALTDWLRLQPLQRHRGSSSCVYVQHLAQCWQIKNQDESPNKWELWSCLSAGIWEENEHFLRFIQD